ncbi:hypothetical protein E1A91_D08G119600v1, partial [Gossypium mustelinum]
RVFSSNRFSTNSKGYEAWAIGKIMTNERINKEAMYRVLRSLWFTKEEVNFVELRDKVILVKFGVVDRDLNSDRTRILNLAPWLFDQCLFALLPYMDRQMALEVGEAISEVMAIDWRDSEEKQVKIDVLKHLRRVVYLVRQGDIEIICAIKYEHLLTFCYKCRIIDHKTQMCNKEGVQTESDKIELQYDGRQGRNTETKVNEERSGEENETMRVIEKEKTKIGEKEFGSSSPLEK